MNGQSGSAASLELRRRAGFALLCVALLVAGLAATATQASAGPSKFIYELCDSALPGGGSPQVSFTANPGVPVGWFNNCAAPGGSLGIQETGPAAATFAYLNVSIPTTPGGYVESMAISAGAAGLGPGNDHTFVYEQGWPANNAGDTQRIFRPAGSSPFLGAAGSGFSIFWNCNGNYAPGCGAGPVIWAHYIAATEVDPKPPMLAVTGPLLAGGVLRGHQELRASASDEGGGLSAIEVLVNGLPAASPALGSCGVLQVKNPSYQGPAALSPTPCPGKLGNSWTLDTAAYPFGNGANSVRVCATDFSTLSEPNKTCSSPATVSVDNSCTESAVAGGEVLRAHFARSKKDEVTVPYGRTAKVSGELADKAGDAISGATICVEIQTQGSRRRPVPVATARTDAQGHFTYNVPPGPNRKVLVAYRRDSFQVGRAVRYRAHARPSIHISAGEVENGDEIRIRGKLPGGRSGGRVVVLQASALGSNRWFTFRRATTNRRGVYHSRYRFDATTSTTTYRIRAEVPRQRGYPWENGHSKPALVKVRG